jgi:hypothetical protein
MLNTCEGTAVRHKILYAGIQADVDYIIDLNHPKDDTIAGSSEVFRAYADRRYGMRTWRRCELRGRFREWQHGCPRLSGARLHSGSGAGREPAESRHTGQILIGSSEGSRL